MVKASRTYCQVSSADVEPSPETSIPSAKTMKADERHLLMHRKFVEATLAGLPQSLSILQVWTVALFLSYLI